MKNWLKLLLAECNTKIHSNGNEWPLLQIAEPGSTQEIEVLEDLVEQIKTQQAVLVIKSASIDDVKENLIFHPYCLLVRQGLFYLKGFSDKSEQLADIPVSHIRRVTALSDVEYRKPNTQEIMMLTSITADNVTNNKKKMKNIAKMKTYWQNFDSTTKYKTGSRDVWYNEVRSLKFTEARQSDLKVYFEVCCQFGHKKQLIINIIIESKLSKDPQINELVQLFKSLDDDLARAEFFDVDWKKRAGDKRQTIQLCTERLPLKEDYELQDPRVFPEQPLHFKWFSEKLDALSEIFQQHLEPS